ncbi:MAG TPA: hypothetical protein VJ650_16810 [Gemmatimonadaceae bacterium]|nr:hypothetical protein [Gemmatimonadaceae bacterium]
MPSRDNRVRTAIEHALRALVLLTLALAVWISARPPDELMIETARAAGLPGALARWTLAPPRRVHVSLDEAPARSDRDWLRAIRRAGTSVAWDGGAIPALAIEVASAASPRGGTTVWVAAPRQARVAIADAIAPIDSIGAVMGAATVFAPVSAGTIHASVGSHRASATVRDTLAPRRVLVLGRASWEAKFVIAALEETGWEVDARLSIAPGMDVTQGRDRTPDTARHAAVVVLEAPSPSMGAAVARYVRAGGGAILTGASGNATSLADIAVGRVGARVRPASIAFADDTPRQALGFLTLRPRSDAIIIEQRDGRVAAAARRVDAGRVAQLGYDETWRWRLAGGVPALDAHRDWWSSLVSSVAYRAAVPLSRETRDDGAPLARLVDALGPPSAPLGALATGTRWSPSPALLFAFISLLLLAELASRRLRGAP